MIGFTRGGGEEGEHLYVGVGWRGARVGVWVGVWGVVDGVDGRGVRDGGEGGTLGGVSLDCIR